MKAPGWRNAVARVHHLPVELARRCRDLSADPFQCRNGGSEEEASWPGLGIRYLVDNLSGKYCLAKNVGSGIDLVSIFW